MCTMALNNELNGVELYFEGKPDIRIITSLKDNGYRWHNKKKCWYAKQNEKTMTKANELVDNKTEFLKVESTDNELYFPPYDNVGSEKIYKSSEIEMLNMNGGYFADENVYLHFYCDSAVMIDLSNALQTGKMCTRYSINHENCCNREPISIILWNENHIRNFKDLIQAVKNSAELQGIKIQKSENKGIKTFSPFVKVKPINTPKKWTVAHLWKAILSGQVYNGKTDSYYTDDYAYDAAYNYEKGCHVDLISFANELIVSSSKGISVYSKEIEGGTNVLTYHNYSFDTKTFYYDEKCNLEEAKTRRETENREKEKVKENMLSQTIDLKSSDINKNSIYDISYLDLDDNTNQYKVKNELIYSNRLFFEDECDYLIIKYKEFIPDDEKVYTISNFHHRPYGDDYKDNRIIDVGNWEHIVTGYALKELLEKGKTFATIREKSFTIEQEKETLNNLINGKMVWLAGVVEDKTDYQKSLYKLNAEQLRIPEVELCTIYQ